MDIVTLETASLGNRSYVVHDERTAVVIDPQRDIDRVRAVVERLGVRVAAVLETHVHNDYVSGGPQLARDTDAAYHVHAVEQLDFPFDPVRPGEEILVGSFALRPVHTPGHTPGHLSYVLTQDGQDLAVFTGGSLLYGSVGRTDLVSPDRTKELTRLQYRSAHALAGQLSDNIEVRPTHGFGSFCSSGATAERDRSTIGVERRDNQVFTAPDEDSFVRELLAGLDDYPAYYAHMAPLNRAGAPDMDLSALRRVDTTELLRRIHASEWVVDLRGRRDFARRHVPGTVNVELADTASIDLGWLAPWGAPLTLIADEEDDLAQMRRQLLRIGVDRPAASLAGDLDAASAQVPTGEYPVADFAALRAALDRDEPPLVLDARRDREWEDAHLPGALHIPLHRLPDRMDEVPRDRDVWVHCASGYRAAIAASLLARAGRRVTLVDDQFEPGARRHFALASGLVKT